MDAMQVTALPETKRCLRCRETKRQSEFFTRHRRHSPRPSYCKSCTKKEDEARRRALHPEQVIAKRRVASAVRSGRLTRPERCSRCGTRCKAHGHHEDYERPLEVVWLCPQCHTNLHMEKRRMVGTDEYREGIELELGQLRLW